MRKERFVVDYQVIGTCNMHCNFCDGAPKKFIGQPTTIIKKGIDKLVEAGVNTIVFTGGEPLLRKDMAELIYYTYLQGIEAYLSTNAVLLFKYYGQFKDYISCLGMPLDGSTPEMNKQMSREGEQYGATTTALRYFKSSRPLHQVKVGTVVSKINHQDLLSIGNHLFNNPDLRSPDIWRLYQFTPLGDGLHNRELHEITDAFFEDTWKNLQKRFPTRLISPLSNADSDNSYIFINPVQEIQILTGDQYKPMGNLQKISSQEFSLLKERYINVVDKGRTNRKWLDAK